MIIILIGACVVVSFLTGGIYLLYRGSVIRKTFGTVYGTVIEVREKFNTMSDHREIKHTIEYEVNGVRYRTNNVVPKGNNVIGDSVAVTYNKENPKEVRDVTLYTAFGTVLTAIGCMLAVAIIVLVYSLLF